MRYARHSLKSFQQARCPFWQSLVLILCILFGLARFGLAEQSERKYGPYTLEEWHQVIKLANAATLAAPEYVEGLLQIIQDDAAPQPSRRLAAQTLGRIGPPAQKAVPVFVQYLKSPGEDAEITRLWALKGLALLGVTAHSACEAVTQLIVDDDQPFLLRVNAMDTLGRIGVNQPTTVQTLLHIINLPQTDASDRAFRMHAVEAMWYLGPVAAPALPTLIRAAQEDWPLMRLAACAALGEIGARAEIAIPLLADTILFDDAGEVREAAADALGKIGAAAIPAITHLAEDPDLDVGKLAIRAAQQQRSNQQIQTLLVKELSEKRSILRVLAADALLRDSPDHRLAMITLINELVSEDRETKRRASEILRILVTTPGAGRDNFVESQSDSRISPQAKLAGHRILDRIDDHSVNR